MIKKSKQADIFTTLLMTKISATLTWAILHFLVFRCQTTDSHLRTATIFCYECLEYEKSESGPELIPPAQK